MIEVIFKKKIERRLKYNLVDRLCHQAKEEFEFTFHTLVFYLFMQKTILLPTLPFIY